MIKAEIKTFSCKDCGGDLQFNPGTDVIECPYCGVENKIAIEKKEIEELDFASFLEKAEQEEQKEEIIAVRCNSCGAQISLGKNITASECPFCASKIVAQSKSIKEIKPKSLLPFKIGKKQAAESFKIWLKKIWFAPNKVKNFARIHGFNGIYTPYWTYDFNTTTSYIGQRGKYYYVDVEYTTPENGKTVKKTRKERRTRWYPANGTVNNTFDDVLVIGSNTLPKKYAERLEPWDLKSLTPYNAEYLSGFRVESYSIGLKDGFREAQRKADPVIVDTIKRDIGGDEQRINSKNVFYRGISFKHILLPIWVSAYRYKDKVYRFLVNARTGEVQGERPWSWVKIAFASVVAALIVGIILYFILQSKT